MNEFKPGSKIRRVVRIHSVDAPVQLEIAEDGISMWVKGSRKRITLSWGQAARASITGTDVPSFLMGDPVGLLGYQAKSAQTRATSRAGSEE